LPADRPRGIAHELERRDNVYRTRARMNACVIGNPLGSAVIRAVLDALPFPVMVPGVFQLSHSFSDRLTHQDKPQPHFPHIQFY
jgi:hypothetical protein